MKKIEKEKNRPAANLPYQNISKPFRLQYLIPMEGIEIFKDENGVCYISAKGGSVDNLVAGDNIELTRREDGSTVISSVNTEREIYGGENVVVTIDPETGAAVISAYFDGIVDGHYKGIFKSVEDLLETVPTPEQGDYGLVRDIVITDGETTWNGRYKLAFFDAGKWEIVDQMLTFTDNPELLKMCWSVGGSSPVIYLPKVAGSGNFWDLLNIPIVATPVATVIGNTITVTCETDGAEIWYSTDGSMPHVNGTKYTGPITVNEATSFRFVGIKNGMINSLEAVANADFSLQAPVIELDWTTGEISMTNPNSSGEIYYTTDGNEPTDISTHYSDPFIPSVGNYPQNIRLKAVVYDSGTGTYSPVSAQSFDRAVVVGEFTSNANTGDTSLYFYVSESREDYAPSSDGELHYTTDGSNPDVDSDVMTSQIFSTRYGGVDTYKMIGLRPGYMPSSIRTHVRNYEKPSPPSISYDGEQGVVTLALSGNLVNTPVVPLMTDDSQPSIGARIYYTLDGSTPTNQSALYTGPIQISGNTTVKAVVVAYGQYSSDVATDEIVLTNAPAISLDSDTGYVSISGPAGATIRYTTDGSTPTLESHAYSEPFSVMAYQTVTIKALAVLNGQESPVTEETYRKLRWTNDGQNHLDINYLGGVVSETPRRHEDGATVTYGFSGSSSPSSWLSYNGPVEFPLFENVARRDTLYFRQTKQGYIPSIMSSSYAGETVPDAPLITYDEHDGTATIALGGNTVDIQLQTNNNAPNVGARIYYTLDGSTPTAQTGTLYNGNPVAVPLGTSAIKAITICYGEYESEVTTEEVSPEPTRSPMYFEAAEANSTVSMASTLETAPDLEYSTDGVTWQEWQHTTAEGVHTFDTLTLTALGDRVYLRGDNPNGFGFIPEGADMPLYSQFDLTGKIAAGGNIMSMIDKDAETTEIPSFGFLLLFGDLEGDNPNQSLTAAASMSTVTSIGEYGCGFMYYRCTALTVAADMPALTTIGPMGCASMYEYCTSLIAAANTPLLTSISYGGCAAMYSVCTALAAAADMPALTTIEEYGCALMYGYCAALAAAANMPLLTTIGDEGCDDMYEGCTFDMSDDGTTLNFDFPAPPVIAGEETYATAYNVANWMGNTKGFTEGDMYFEAEEANSTVTLTSTLETAPDLEYSTDGVTWLEWPHTTAEGMHTFDTLTLTAIGDRVYLRGDNPDGLGHFTEGSGKLQTSHFSMTGKIAAGGNIMRLLDKDMEMTEIPAYGFVFLFGAFSEEESNTSLTAAAGMPTVTTIGKHGCAYMYATCKSLIAAAAMPSVTTIDDSGCIGMYNLCTELTVAASMPLLTTIGGSGCRGKYDGCTKLIAAAAMPALTAIGDKGCDHMYAGCTFDMSDDGTTLNFDFPTPPITTTGETPETYADAYDVAFWMGNTNGFTNP